MTSNAGSNTKSGSVGFARTANEQGRERAMKALQEFLRPEFINRVDEIVYFNQLTEDNFKEIAKIMLQELTDNLKEKGITFGPVTEQDAVPDFYPYWFAWAEFSVEETLTRNPKSYQHLL